MPSTSADSDDSRSKRDRSPLLRRVALHALWVAAVLLVALGVAGGIYVDRLAQRTPDVTDLRQAQSARPSLIVAADGRLLASFSRAQHVHVPLDRIAPVVVQALIATEDERFHAHRGIDWRRTASAAVHTLFGDTQGGSTLTQQLARNLFPEEIGRARTLERKLKEMIVARRLERVFDKRQILAAYLNTAPFLYNVVGIEMAARTYYGKHAAALGAPEAAMLVGMLKGTYHYNPVIHPERALARRNVVLAQMARAGVLAPAQAEALAAQPLALSFRRPSESPGLAPHFTAQVRRLALAWAEANDRDLHADGLVIHTPLDMRLQEAATEAVRTQTAALQQVADVEWSARRLPVSSTSIARYAKAHAQVQPFAWFWESRPELLADFVRETPAYRRAVDDGAGPDKALATLMHDDAALAALRSDKTRLEAGFVALDPASGEVRAWVGSRDFVTDQFDHVAQAARQPGSTFKPFVYGAALEAGMSPDYGYLDRPVEIALADGSVWRPSDMGEPSLEPMTLAEALVHSRNTVTAQLMLDIGVPTRRRLRACRRRGPQPAGCRALARAGHEPGDAAGDGERLRRDRLAGRAACAAPDAAYHRPPRPGAGRLRARPAACDARGHGGGAHRHAARRGAARHRHGAAHALRHPRRRGGQDRHLAGQHGRLVHPHAPAPGGRRVGGFQRPARAHAQQPLGPGRLQRAAAGGRLLSHGVRAGLAGCERHLRRAPARAARAPREHRGPVGRAV